MSKNWFDYETISAIKVYFRDGTKNTISAADIAGLNLSMSGEDKALTIFGHTDEILIAYYPRRTWIAVEIVHWPAPSNRMSVCRVLFEHYQTYLDDIVVELLATVTPIKFAGTDYILITGLDRDILIEASRLVKIERVPFVLPETSGNLEEE